MVLESIPSNEWKLEATDMWFKCASTNETIYRYDGVTLFELSLPKPPRISLPFEIYSIYKDRKGNVWFGTNPCGVCRYNGKSLDWITESDVTEIHNGPANGVRSIAEDKNGDLWFNTEYRYHIRIQHLYSLKNSSDSIFYDRIKSIGSLSGNEDSSLNEYLSIVKDDNHNLWMATYRNGVWKYDGDKIIHYPIQVDTKDILIYCLYKDKKGDLWLGTIENGLFKFNGKEFVQFKIVR